MQHNFSSDIFYRWAVCDTCCICDKLLQKPDLSVLLPLRHAALLHCCSRVLYISVVLKAAAQSHCVAHSCGCWHCLSLHNLALSSTATDSLGSKDALFQETIVIAPAKTPSSTLVLLRQKT